MCKCGYCMRSPLWVGWQLIQTVKTMSVRCDMQNGLLVIIWRHSSYGEAGWASIHPRISTQSLSLLQSVVDSIRTDSFISPALRTLEKPFYFVHCRSLCAGKICALVLTLASSSFYIPIPFIFLYIYFFVLHDFFLRLDRYRVEEQLPGRQVLPFTKNPLFSYSRTRAEHSFFNSLSYCVLGHLMLLVEAEKVAFVCFVTTMLRMLL